MHLLKNIKYAIKELKKELESSIAIFGQPEDIAVIWRMTSVNFPILSIYNKKKNLCDYT